MNRAPFAPPVLLAVAGVAAVMVMGVSPTGAATASTSMASAARQAAPPPAPPTLPDDVRGKDGVKAYLLAVCDSCNQASADLKAHAEAYARLVAKHEDAPAAAAKAQPQKIAALIRKLRDDYERLDSYGYEYMEGIVAGVPDLAHYDVELDSGMPGTKDSSGPSGATSGVISGATSGGGGGDPIAEVVIQAGDMTIDHEGALNNFLIEPTVFGTHRRFTQGSARLPGFDKPVNLPRPALIVALADYAVDGYARLTQDAKAWQPTDADCFKAIHNMTPTLAGYFDEWKQAREGKGASGGRFVAVSRVSDMRGIMSSVQLTWQGVKDKVDPKDAALAKSITEGYDRILNFIDRIEARDQAKALPIQAIDALGSQARRHADKVTVQIAQAAALVNVSIEGQ